VPAFIAWAVCPTLDAAIVFQGFNQTKKSGNKNPYLDLTLAMKTLKSSSIVFLKGTALAWLVAVASPAYAATVWDGPTINFTHSTPTGNLQDQLTNDVIITRGSSSGGLYNSALETSATLGSPKNTKWAIGSLSDYSTMTFSNCPLKAGNSPSKYVGTNFVVHLINEDIYLSLKLTGWGGEGMIGDRSFSYTRSTPSLTPPTPTISITNPVSGAVFAAPANVSIGADAAVSGGMVTNVEFFANGVSQGAVAVAPFTLTSVALAAGSYTLTAVATASGISATSAVVNVSVVSPVVVNLSGAMLDNGQFSFSYTADAGLTYVVQSSSNLVDWVSLMTNVAPGSPVLFTNVSNPAGAGFYRVGRLPNP
jgi:Bacterial Ig domain